MKFCSGITSLHYVGVTFFEMCPHVLCSDRIFCISQSLSEFSVTEAFYSYHSILEDWFPQSLNILWLAVACFNLFTNPTLWVSFSSCVIAFLKVRLTHLASSGNATILSCVLSSLCGIIFHRLLMLQATPPKPHQDGWTNMNLIKMRTIDMPNWKGKSP